LSVKVIVPEGLNGIKEGFSAPLQLPAGYITIIITITEAINFTFI
jgi:hypothetical protein